MNLLNLTVSYALLLEKEIAIVASFPFIKKTLYTDDGDTGVQTSNNHIIKVIRKTHN